MDTKIYITANDYLRDTFRLARKILDSNWVPDELIALWRGGAPVGVGLHEFFKYSGYAVNHHVVKCCSYTGIAQRRNCVDFEESGSLFDRIEAGRRVLIVDDVFDTGKTMQAVCRRLAGTGASVKVATVYWKPASNQTDFRPDFYLRETDEWIVFPHEMEGLTPEEIRHKDPELYALLKRD